MSVRPGQTIISESQALDNSTINNNKFKDNSEEESRLLNGRKPMRSLTIIRDKLISKDVKAIFNAETQSKNTINSLKKEVKVNDTIVALISFIIILLTFLQLDQLIWANYKMTDYVLTMRTAIIILSIPNSRILT